MKIGVISRVKDGIASYGKYLTWFMKWTIISIIIGIICGYVGVGFCKSLELVMHLFSKNSFCLYLLPLLGIIIAFLYKVIGEGKDSGTNEIFESLRSYDKISIKKAPLIFVGTVLTHLGGGSSGREGAALQIGGSIGSFFGRILKFDKKDIRAITMCGMSSVFAGIFGMPLTATMFSLEVYNVGTMYYNAFMPCLISSIVSIAIAKANGIKFEVFNMIDIPEFNAMNVARIVVLSILVAIVSIIFCMSLKGSKKAFDKFIKNDYIKIIVGGIIIILLTKIVGTTDYNGVGTAIIEKAINGASMSHDFIFKIIFTAITLGCGYKGGEIVPSFFIGATFGSAYSNFLGLDSSFGARVGLIAMFCSVINCPVTAMMLSIEMFGEGGLLFYAIACAISYIMSGYFSLYGGQRIMYSKFETDFVNAQTK